MGGGGGHGSRARALRPPGIGQEEPRKPGSLDLRGLVNWWRERGDHGDPGREIWQAAGRDSRMVRPWEIREKQSSGSDAQESEKKNLMAWGSH